MDSCAAAPQRVVMSPDDLSRMAPTHRLIGPPGSRCGWCLPITDLISMASALLLTHRGVHLLKEEEERERLNNLMLCGLFWSCKDPFL